MFFSVIIPTYNPRNFLPIILGSIKKNECLDEIEIILSDDCSPEPFEDVLEDFKELNIKVITNEHHAGFPRDGRQHGAEVATGKWITFADQDDYFLDNSFDYILHDIKNTEIKDYFITKFVVEDADTMERTIEDGIQGWTHGKFVEKEFWNKYGIKYDKVKYCEDVNVITHIECTLATYNLKKYVYNRPVYVWKVRNDSLADEKYYINSMYDYIKSSLKIIVEVMEQNKDNKELVENMSNAFIQNFLHMYFYLQGPCFITRKQKLLGILLYMQPYYERYKAVIGIDTMEFIRHVFCDLSQLYSEIRDHDYHQIPFVEQFLFADWMRAYFD